MGRTGRWLRCVVVVWALLLSCATAQAQFTANYQTNVISAVASNWVGDYIVGSNTASDLLLVIGGGGLSNSNGFIGYEVSAGNDTAVVAGSGSAWTNGEVLWIGLSGPGNRLMITNGGLVDDYGGVLGENFSSSNNLVLVDGTGSVWSNAGNVFIGDHGPGNQLIVTNGGRVFSGFNSDTFSDFIGGGTGNSSSNNAVVVTGTGSVWSAVGRLIMGGNAPGNQISILNGGMIADLDGDLGNGSSSNNVVFVDGAGSVWSNRQGVSIGSDSTANKLIVTGGGAVSALSSATIGQYSGSSNNLVLVSGSGSVWNVDPTWGTNDGDLVLGEYGSGNSLIISNGGSVLDGGEGWVSHQIGSQNNRILVSGAGSIWSNHDLSIGTYDGNDSLVINAGAVVLCGDYFELGGYWPWCSNNTTVVSDSNSLLSCSVLNVGRSGCGNQLTVTNGAMVSSDVGLIGRYPGNSNNTVLVTGSGSVWSNGSDLNIGYQGTADQLTVADQGAVLAQSITVGNVCGSQGSLTVAGGTVIVTNATQTGVLEVLGGTVVVNSGTLLVDTLVITNACGNFIHTGGTLIVGSLVLDPNLSATGDGLPNWWKQKYGLDPLSTNGVNGANGDPDGDGQSNWQEYLAGTDPTNSASVLRITSLVAEGSDVLLSWSTAGGHTNIVQAASGLGGSYSNLSPNIIISGSGDAATNYLDPGALTNGPARFYRIALVP